MAGRLTALVALLLVLPALGAWLAGQPLPGPADVPPRPAARTQPGFNLAVFIALGAGIALVLAWFGRAWYRTRPAPPVPRGRFPWWGWAGLAWTGLAWALAWSRLEWMQPLQLYTFTPLWLGYIVVMNALAQRLDGRSLLTDRPGHLLRLAAFSALFWWLFEYLNLYVGNWHYRHTDHLHELAYSLHASLAFATVLPAVASTEAWLRLRLPRPWALPPWPALSGRRAAQLAWLLALAGLPAVAAWPQYLFPLIWLLPGVLLFALQARNPPSTRLASLASGDWRPLYLPALAALLCGLFWELWNFHSLAQWRYTIPYAQALHLFEMPLLGYAGYLPFGLTCALVIDELDGQRLPAAADTRNNAG